MRPVVLTFDIGTQSLRGAIVDDAGTILAKCQERFAQPYFSVNPGWAEQHGEFYWENICKVSTFLKNSHPDLWEDILAVSITTIRDTCICVGKDGVPVRPAILWLDKREVTPPPLLPKPQYLIFKAAGMSKTAKLIKKITHSNWLMQHEPENWEKTYKYMMLSGYMNFCFTGKMIDCTANIIGHIPFDNKQGTWMSPKALNYCLFPIPTDKLCELCQPGDIIGPITKKASEETGIREGLPLIATGSDKGCETLGLSCITPEKAAISFGTTATVQFTTPTYVEPQKYFPAYVSPYKGHFNPEIEIYRGYWLISWFKKEFAEKEVVEAESLGISAEDLLNKRLAEIPPGCDGLTLQPYFTPGVSMPNAKGAIIGFSDIHTRIHIYRAIIEGINFALMEGMKSIEKRTRKRTESIYLAGGGSLGDEICQITADMFGVPVNRIQTHEAAVIGSSIITFCAVGHFASVREGIEKMVHIKDTFLPDMKAHKRYNQIYHRIFSKIFEKLKPLYEISKEMEEE